MVALVENGTHAPFGTRMAGYGVDEHTLSLGVVTVPSAGMLCPADRNFVSCAQWHPARTGRADMVWRIKKNLRLPRQQSLPDGS